VTLAKGLRAKLAPRYLGPFPVTAKIGTGLAFRVELPSALSRVHNVFPVSSLKQYHSDGNTTPPPLPEMIDGELEWAVDWIESTQGEGRHRQYLIHWVGFEEPNWENVSQLTNCPQALQAFWDNKGLPCPHPIPGPGGCLRASSSLGRG
jgi:hypothetical protein